MFNLNHVSDTSFTVTMQSMLIGQSSTIQRHYSNFEERSIGLSFEFAQWLVNETLAFAGSLQDLRPGVPAVDSGYRSAVNYFEFACLKRKGDRVRSVPPIVILREWWKLRTYLKAMLPIDKDQRKPYADILRNMNEVNDLILSELESGTRINLSTLQKSA